MPTINDFQRPYSIWRSLNPLNIIGSFNGYATCNCGNSLWCTHGSFATSYHGGHLICNACYKKFQKEIRLSDHYLQMQPRRDGVLLCYDKDCELHKNDSRFEWISQPMSKDCWMLKPEEWEALK